MTNPQSYPSPDSSPETMAGVIVSLGFWVCMLISAMLFAGVALAPKFMTFKQLRNQYDTNQLELVELERQSNQMQRVIDAIRNDQEFAAELTRIELDTAHHDEEVLPVAGDLTLDARSRSDAVSHSEKSEEFYEPLLKALAVDRSLRMGVLASAALLFVISFTVLQPARAQHVTSGAADEITMIKTLKSRYVHRV